MSIFNALVTSLERLNHVQTLNNKPPLYVQHSSGPYIYMGLVLN